MPFCEYIYYCISAIFFIHFVPRMLHVSGELHIMLLLCYGLIVFHFEYMSRLTNDQRVWICLEHARFQNAAEVRRRWPGRWGNTPAPTKRTIRATYKKMFAWSDMPRRYGLRRTRQCIRVIEVTRFRTNKSCLYFVNNTSFYNKHFIKFHQFTDNNTSLCLATLG
jgi:hypothetical protein